jgi:hypothetical protein
LTIFTSDSNMTVLTVTIGLGWRSVLTVTIGLGWRSVLTVTTSFGLQSVLTISYHLLYQIRSDYMHDLNDYK